MIFSSLSRWRRESRLWKSGQDAKWNFCLTAGMMSPRIGRDHEQPRTPGDPMKICRFDDFKIGTVEGDTVRDVSEIVLAALPTRLVSKDA